MRVFLDVGAHVGETIEAVLDPKYQFDRIIGFEPAAACRKAFHHLADPRIEIEPFGLSSRSGDRELYSAGALAGSVFQDMPGVDRHSAELCRFVRASDWLRENIRIDDTVYMKLNCEGSECDILEDLLETRQFAELAAVMIDFDVTKIPSQRHREVQVREKLAQTGLTNYHFSSEVMVGSTHIARVQNWLHHVRADRCTFATKLRQARYVLYAPAHVRRAVLGGRYGRFVRSAGGWSYGSRPTSADTAIAQRRSSRP